MSQDTDRLERLVRYLEKRRPTVSPFPDKKNWELELSIFLRLPVSVLIRDARIHERAHCMLSDP